MKTHKRFKSPITLRPPEPKKPLWHIRQKKLNGINRNKIKQREFNKTLPKNSPSIEHEGVKQA